MVIPLFLQRKGLLISDGENAHLSLAGIDDDPMLQSTWSFNYL